MAIFFPEQWNSLRSAVPAAERDDDLVEVYCRLLNDADSDVKQRAVDAWCMWESTTSHWPPTNRLDERFTNLIFALAFTRIVTHYVSHNAWLEDGILLRHADSLANIPGILVNGRFDFQAPIGNAWELKQVWPRAELVIVDDVGHSPNASVTEELIRATDKFASFR